MIGQLSLWRAQCQGKVDDGKRCELQVKNCALEEHGRMEDESAESDGRDQPAFAVQEGVRTQKHVDQGHEEDVKARQATNDPSVSAHVRLAKERLLRLLQRYCIRCRIM